MKLSVRRFSVCAVSVCVLQFSAANLPAQTPVLVSAFNTEAEVMTQGWQNWFGTAYYQAVWDSSDASNNAASGSLKIEAFYPDAGIGGCCGPQFVVMNGYDGINPPLAGNGNTTSGLPLATNVEFDVRFSPDSIYDTNSGNWRSIEVGTRGTTYNQYTFGSFTLSHTNTGWVHVTIPINASVNWTNIPNVYFKHYSGAASGWIKMYIDNVSFTTADVPFVPPSLALEKAKPGLRMFAGPSQYNRTQVATVDTNQSWVGGTYPVTYSFTISSYDVNPPLNEFHMFLTPLNYVQDGTVNAFTDYSSASNNLRLQITGGAAGTTTAFAVLDWKTNLINANPDHEVLRITNNTAVGTWTVQFDSANSGSLTAPGASPAPFTLPADVAATFANPLVAFFGVQPNPTAAIGQHVDFTRIRTANVASPGVPVDTDFTAITAIDTNIWRTASVSANSAYMQLVPASAAWWVKWGYPDGGLALATKADLGNKSILWKTPVYYAGYDSNAIAAGLYGSANWALLSPSALPTVTGLSNGTPASTAFFRLQKPAPAE